MKKNLLNIIKNYHREIIFGISVICFGILVIKVGVPKEDYPDIYESDAYYIQKESYEESSMNDEFAKFGLVEPLSTQREWLQNPIETTIEETTEETTIYEPEEETEPITEEDYYIYDGPVLNSRIGTIEGPSGKETYYNLPMGGIISIMRNAGFSEEEYPYWVRDDGCKMLGNYIMVAADLSIRPRGSLIECSLGMAIVCDTGNFIYSNPYQLDIATTW